MSLTELCTRSTGNATSGPEPTLGFPITVVYTQTPSNEKRFAKTDVFQHRSYRIDFSKKTRFLKNPSEQWFGQTFMVTSNGP